MKWIAFFKCLLILLVLSGCQQKRIEPQSQPLKKKAEFKREVFDVNKYPGLTAVGKIKILETKWCSMTLVAEDIGITAGHCFLKSGTKFNQTDFTEVVFNTKDGNPIKGIKVERVLKGNLTLILQLLN